MRKEARYWYCDERKMFGVPHVWSKVESGYPVGKVLVLVTTNDSKSLIVRSPTRVASTVRLFKRLGVVWWSYIPLAPRQSHPKPGSKTLDDMLLYSDWEVDKLRSR